LLRENRKSGEVTNSVRDNGRYSNPERLISAAPGLENKVENLVIL
jgi:hypothetical protein